MTLPHPLNPTQPRNPWLPQKARSEGGEKKSQLRKSKEFNSRDQPSNPCTTPSHTHLASTQNPGLRTNPISPTPRPYAMPSKQKVSNISNISETNRRTTLTQDIVVQAILLSSHNLPLHCTTSRLRQRRRRRRPCHNPSQYHPPLLFNKTPSSHPPYHKNPPTCVKPFITCIPLVLPLP